MKIPQGLQPLIDDGVIDAVLRSLKSGISCLGYAARESGHSRVPEPPDRTTGWIVI